MNWLGKSFFKIDSMTSDFEETPISESISRVSSYFLSRLCITKGEKGVTGPPRKTLLSFSFSSSSLSGCKEKSFNLI